MGLLGIGKNVGNLVVSGHITKSFQPRDVTPEKKAVYEQEVKAWLGGMTGMPPIDSVKFIRQGTSADIRKFESQQKGDNVMDFKNSVRHSLYNDQAPFLLEVTSGNKKATVMAFEYEGGKHVSTWPRDIVWSDAATQPKNTGWLRP